MSESALMISLRLIHIIGGIFWVGTAMLIAWFLGPAQRATGIAGLTFFEELMVNRKLQVYLPVSMGAAILSGIAMYIRFIVITHGEWASSPTAKVLGFGAICGIVAGGIGASVGRRTGERMVAIAQDIRRAGGAPTDAQRAELSELGNKAAPKMRIVAALLVIAVAAMASARYI